MNCSYYSALSMLWTALNCFATSTLVTHALPPVRTTPLAAFDRAWDGGAGTNNWNDGANWSPDGSPSTNQSVSIATPSTIVLPSGSNVNIRLLEIGDNCRLTVQDNATLNISGTSNPSRIYLAGANANLTNEGLIILSDGSDAGMVIVFGAHFDNFGSITINNSGISGGIHMISSSFTNHLGGSMLINGTAAGGDGLYHNGNCTATNFGTITIQNVYSDGISSAGLFHNYGTVNIPGIISTNDFLVEAELGMQFLLHAGSLFTGMGIIDHTAFVGDGGTISPGRVNAAGILTFSNVENFGTIDIRANVFGSNGAGQPNGHDQVQVNGLAQLNGGDIFVQTEPSFVPSNGQTFTLMTYQSKSGANPVFHFPSTPGYTWSASVGATSIVVALMSSGLPIEWGDFYVEQAGEAVLLSWETYSESNNRGFQIERALGEDEWVNLGFVAGNGTSSEAHAYFWEDKDPAPGMNYYRLVQEDFDGRQDFSPVLALDVVGSFRKDFLDIFPNPCQGGTINYALPEGSDEAARIQIYDAIGTLVFEDRRPSPQGQIQLPFAAPGVYFFNYRTKDKNLSKRLVLQ